MRYPYIGINGQYLEREFLESVWEELAKKAPLYAAGIIEPSPCEKFAYLVLNQISLQPPTS